MVDSSVLIEYLKQTKSSLLNSLLQDDKIICCINETIVSEFLYNFLKINFSASPQSAKSSKKIREIFEANRQNDLLYLFELLPTDLRIYKLVPHLMSTYNLLPNDAIILATCKINGITQIASHDSDFVIPCQQEGITLLTEK